jgi:hypothetical protein
MRHAVENFLRQVAAADSLKRAGKQLTSQAS